MACPPLKFRKLARSRFDRPMFEIRRPEGTVVLVRRRDGHFEIANIWVEKKTEMRKGIGTCFYEAAAKFACSQGKQLFSDKLRTTASDGFWRKQVAKGRAACATRCDKAAVERSEEPRREVEHVANCRSGCAKYVLQPCETSLSGLKSRKRRR